MSTSTTHHHWRTRLAITVFTALGVVAALVLIVHAPSHSRAARPVGAIASPAPTHRSPRPGSHAADLRQAIRAAYQFAHQRGYRIDIATRDLHSGQTWGAGDSGTFGTGSVVKILIAAKMLLTGAMHGADADEAYRMITYSDDDDGTDLWTRFGAEQIITWLSEHYGVHVGEPNRRPNYWGNTQITARSLVAFYRCVSKDSAVRPWLFNAMAHAQRIASDGTDQYFGIPNAGGGHTVKQSWGIRSAGDGYGDDATVNSTGIVTASGHTYAVVILTEGHHNAAAADSRGYNHEQGVVITEVARRVLDALRSDAGGQ